MIYLPIITAATPTVQLSVDCSEQHRTPSRELYRVKLSLRHVVSMDVEPLYCAEQIRVPEALPDILKQWTKEVIRQNPRDINEFSARCVLVCVCGRACMRVCICAYVYVYVCCSVCVEASPACGLACCLSSLVALVCRWFEQRAKEHSAGKK